MGWIFVFSSFDRKMGKKAVGRNYELSRIDDLLAERYLENAKSDGAHDVHNVEKACLKCLDI